MTPLRIPRKVDLRELTARTKRLAVKTRWAYVELLDHYWEQGELPTEDHDLAAAAGSISVVALRRMKVQLGWVFATDSDGRWRDLDLEAERAIAVALSAKRAKVGMVGAIMRHAKAAGQEVAPETAEAVANAMAIAKSDGTEMTVEEALSAVASASPFASAVPGSGARVEDDEDDDSKREILESSSSSSSNPGPREAERMASAIPAATPEPVPNASRGQASPTPSPEVDVAALERQYGLTSAELLRLVTERAGKVRQGSKHSGQSRLDPDLRSPAAMAPLWGLVAQGCDPRNDVVPAFAKCQGLTEDFLGKIDASFIVKAALARRDHRLSTLGSVMTASAAMAKGGLADKWIPNGSEQRKAWDLYEKANPEKAGKWLGQDYKGAEPRFRGTKGWWRKTEWPPGYPAAEARSTVAA